MKIQVCEVCGLKPAIRLCDGCGRMLCPDCEVFEIWGHEAGQVETKHFCARCYSDPEINPWFVNDVAAGLSELLSVVRQIEEGDSRLFVAF